MADYVKKLLEKDPLRLEGYKAYLTCINKTTSERELQKFKETIKQVKQCCEELRRAEEKEAKPNSPSINKITDNSGNILNAYKTPVDEGILEKIKTVQRGLLKPEIKEVLLDVLKAATHVVLKPNAGNIEDEFNIEPFIQGFKGIITPNIRDNLKNLQKTIIAPIMQAYKGLE